MHQAIAQGGAPPNALAGEPDGAECINSSLLKQVLMQHLYLKICRPRSMLGC
jgi:hypothetical protein